MTIDQRLEALTARHEALTQSVELMHKDLELMHKDLELTHQNAELSRRDTADVKERTKKLEEQMLVQAELTARFERRVDNFMQRTEEWIESAEDRFAELRSVSQAVLERMDRFIQGREHDGHES